MPCPINLFNCSSLLIDSYAPVDDSGKTYLNENKIPLHEALQTFGDIDVAMINPPYSLNKKDNSATREYPLIIKKNELENKTEKTIEQIKELKKKEQTSAIISKITQLEKEEKDITIFKSKEQKAEDKSKKPDIQKKKEEKIVKMKEQKVVKPKKVNLTVKSGVINIEGRPEEHEYDLSTDSLFNSVELVLKKEKEEKDNEKEEKEEKEETNIIRFKTEKKAEAKMKKEDKPKQKEEKEKTELKICSLFSEKS